MALSQVSRASSVAPSQGGNVSANFRWSASRYFLTYSQIGEEGDDEVDRKMGEIAGISHWKAVRETHGDGGHHWHVIVVFEKALRRRGADLFDINGLHPNVVV